jgi:hypothetical protein
MAIVGDRAKNFKKLPGNKVNFSSLPYILYAA